MSQTLESPRTRDKLPPGPRPGLVLGHTLAYMKDPLGFLGPRICIGNHFAMMESVLVLATIVRGHRLAVLPGQTLDLFPSITLRPRQGLRARLEPRSKPPSQPRSVP
jgi:hypothetical protein